MKIQNKALVYLLFGLLTSSSSFNLLSMDDYKIGEIIGYEIVQDNNIVRNYLQKIEHGKFLAYAEVVRGSYEGYKSLQLVRFITHDHYVALKEYSIKDAFVIGADLVRKFHMLGKAIEPTSN